MRWLPSVNGKAEAYALIVIQLIMACALQFVGYEKQALACGLGYLFGSPTCVAGSGKKEYHDR